METNDRVEATEDKLIQQHSLFNAGMLSPDSYIKNIRAILTTHEREAVAEYKQFVLNVLDGIDIADGQCNTKAIRHALKSRI